MGPLGRRARPSWSVALWIVVAGVVAGGCRSDPRLGAPTARARTEVVFIGTVHHGHLGTAFPFPILAAQLRRARPDVILAEIPPTRFQRVLQARGAGRPDAWLDAFPELSAVVFPVANDLRVKVVPVSGYHAAYARDLRAYREAHPNGPEGELYVRAAQHLERRTRTHGVDPEWIASPAHARLHAWVDRNLQRVAGDAMGAAAPRVRDARHVRLIVDAIRANPGKRIAIVFDARRRWAIEQAIVAEPELDVRLLDPRTLLRDRD